MTTPTVPPAVAEFLVQQAAARHVSPTRAALAKADSVVAAAERVPGVSVTHVQVYQPHDDPTYATLNLHVEPEALTQPVAVELGLTGRRVQPYEGQALETFRGVVDGVDVSMSVKVPASALAVAS